MGNDGGSIPTRTDLVRTKAKAAEVDKWASLLIAWFTCALSKRPLEPPIVSCPLGRLYNKDSLLQFLLQPSPSDPDSPFGIEGSLIAGHVRSLKRDTTTLVLHPNPSLPSSSSSSSSSSSGTASKSGIESTQKAEKARWVCPITLREMNGSSRFVYLRGCGCTLSEAALKELKSGKADAGLETCPVCGKTAEELGEPLDGDKRRIRTVVINPGKEESEKMRAEMESERERAASVKKESKKRKKATSDPDPAATNTTATDEPPTKRRELASVQPSARHAPTVSTPAALKAELEKLREKGEKEMSGAVRSLYAKKDQGVGGDGTRDKNGRSTWMVMGTFTRYSGS